MGICTSNSSSSPDYYVYVKTGDVKGAGTDANISIVLFDADGNASRKIKLDKFLKNDFERGRVDRFPVSNLANFGSISRIDLLRDSSGPKDDWFADIITIKECSNSKEYVFPVQRWVEANKQISIYLHDSCLPQHDKNAEFRKAALEEKKKLYEFHEKAEGMPVQVKNCPPQETFSDDYKWDIVKNKANTILQSKIIGLTTSAWETLDDLKNVYKNNLPPPYGMKNWKLDKEFGAQRLTGCNPVMLELCNEIPEKFKVTDELVEPIMGMNIQEAINQKRLFIVDLKKCENLTCTDGRKVCAPLALFYVDSEKYLMPVAIQLQQSGEDNPVFLPTDPEYTWMLAKMFYNNADASVHQAVVHLGLTHIFMESVVVCSHRNLSQSHPMFRLLAPHFLYLVAINTRALGKLVSEGGWVDKCMGIGRIGMFELVKRYWNDWRMDVHGILPKELESRGVMDPEILPNYHYRDDALLLYEAIQKYVTEVVEGVYTSVEKLTDDHEIQAWVQELTAPPPEGFGVKGVPGNGSFTCTGDLISALTCCIYSSSVAHAASNFCQYDEYAFPPNYPPILYTDPPKNKDPLSEKDVLLALPDKKTTLDIMVVAKILSDRGTNALGDFEIKYQYDPIGTKAVEEFRKDLKRIEDIINQRNSEREMKYPYLNPAEVPNAISI